MKLNGKRAVGLLAGIVLGLSANGSVLAAIPEQAAACAACHGEDGNSNAPIFPKIAGQPKEYLAKQLRDIISGRRKSEVMQPEMFEYLKSADIEVIAAHYAAQKSDPSSVPDKKLAAEGQKIFMEGNAASDVPACAACHQPDAQGRGKYPHLAGQRAEYLYQQLQNFSSGYRSNDLNRVMRVVAKRLTEQEMRAVAEYLSGL